MRKVFGKVRTKKLQSINEQINKINSDLTDKYGVDFGLPQKQQEEITTVKGYNAFVREFEKEKQSDTYKEQKNKRGVKYIQRQKDKLQEYYDDYLVWSEEEQQKLSDSVIKNSGVNMNDSDTINMLKKDSETYFNFYNRKMPDIDKLRTKGDLKRALEVGKLRSTSFYKTIQDVQIQTNTRTAIFNSLGANPMAKQLVDEISTLTPEQFSQLVASDTDMWSIPHIYNEDEKQVDRLLDSIRKFKENL